MSAPPTPTAQEISAHYSAQSAPAAQADSGAPAAPAPAVEAAAPPVAPLVASGSAGPVSWEGFQAFVLAKNGSGIITGLSQARGDWSAGVLTLGCHNGTHCEMLSTGDNHARLRRLVLEYFGPEAGLSFSFEEREPQRNGSEVDREVQAHPAVQRVRKAFEVKAPGQVTLRERR